MNKDVEHFNAHLENNVRAAVQGRKQLHLKSLNMLQSLGVSVACASNVPQTFDIPVHKRQVLIKPSAPSTAYAPEPTLGDDVYKPLLKFIHDYGVEMERHPSLYGNKDEEALRDLFLMALAPHFQSASGETFNKEGKTDILIRHEQLNVFIAECKIWKGVKQYLDALTQLLRYLTWRDSKAAVIVFVQNKELNPVLQQIESETLKHPCFVKAHGKQADGWFSFELHLKDDSTRSVKCAVLCFHFPSLKDILT